MEPQLGMEQRVQTLVVVSARPTDLDEGRLVAEHLLLTDSDGDAVVHRLDPRGVLSAEADVGHVGSVVSSVRCTFGSGREPNQP